MSKNVRRLAVGTLVAGAAGYIAGLLTAPKSGKETRKDIKNKAVEISGEAEKKLKTLHQELAVSADKLKLSASKLSGKAKDRADDLHKEIDEARERARKAISALRAGDEEEIDTVIEDLERLKKVVQKRIKNAVEEIRK